MREHESITAWHRKETPAMKIEFMWKTASSYTNNCPARYKVTSSEGGYVIVGKRVPPEVRPQLRDVGPDEDALWVPDDVIDGLGT
jgi:hypothetical protein